MKVSNLMLVLIHMANFTKAQAGALIKEKGLRVTPHRVAILSTIANKKEPLTVHAIFDTLRKKYSIDQATIYRNLLSLHESGLLRRLDFNHGHAHYELETGLPSSQFVCNRCETIEKLDSKEIDEIIKKVSKRTKKFRTLSSHTIEIYGVCKQCV
jgi:Fur family peroxide stress response transcriptional regulator